MTIIDFPGTPCLELLSLKQLLPNLWRFQFCESTGDANAALLSEMLFSFYQQGHLFSCHPLFQPQARSQRAWRIDSEGMWLLSHLFVNWQVMYHKACPLVVEAEVAEPDGKNGRWTFGFDPATNSDAACWVRIARLPNGTMRVLEVQKWNMQSEDSPMEQWKCQQCGETYRTLIDPAMLVWLKDAPREQKKVCAACHKQLTREGKIIREAK